MWQEGKTLIVREIFGFDSVTSMDFLKGRLKAQKIAQKTLN